MMQWLWHRLRDRRKAPRFREPRLKLRIDGRVCRTADWSLGGFRLSGFPGSLRRLERIRGQIAVPGGPRGDFVAEVIWTGENGDVGFRFLELPSDVFSELTLHHG